MNITEKFAKRKPGSHILPNALNQFVLVMKWIKDKTALKAIIEKHLRVERRAHVYSDWDFAVFLIGMFSGMEHPRIKAFCTSITSARPCLAAAFGMISLPVQSAVSRYLKAVSLATARTVVSLCLQESFFCGPLLSDPAAQILDNRGQGWHVFGFDFQVKAFRERDLPGGEDYPETRRLGPETAKKGYPGRKRGETIQSWAHCLHEGTSLFVSSGLNPGNGDLRDALPESLNAITAVCQRANIDPQFVLLRIDAAGGHFVFLALAVKAGVHFLARYANYAVLKDAGVQRSLNRCRWRRVASACGAGPQRWAAELASVDLALVPELQGLDLGGTVRLIVTRFKKNGNTTSNGQEHGGHIFELFLTSLPAEAFGCAEVAELYFNRAGEENRFAQSNRELNLNHLFSKNPGGQLLAMGIGKLVWNLRAQAGRSGAAPVPAVKAQPRQDVWAEPVLLFPEAGTEAGDAKPAREERPRPFGAVTRRERAAAVIRTMDLSEEARRRGAEWDPAGPAFICGRGHKIPYVHLSRAPRGREICLMIFEAATGVCAGCPLRAACIGSAKADVRKRYSVAIPEAGRERLLEAYALRNGEGHRAPSDNPAILSSCFPPVAGPACGAQEMAPSGLFPAALRQRFVNAARDLTVRVDVRHHGSGGTVTASERKRRKNGRRRTWDERSVLNQLEDDCRVSVLFFHGEDESMSQMFQN